MIPHRRRTFALFVLGFALGACADERDAADTPPGGPATVYVVNHPLEYFAKRIGGSVVQVVLPVPAGEDPAFWSPDPETIVQYQSADLVLRNGAGYAKWADRASLPSSRTVNTAAAFGDRIITIDTTVTHTHGPEGGHEHGDIAFTTWLDPRLAIEQARATHIALTRIRPADTADLTARFQELEADLRALDARLEHVARRIGQAPLLFSHPVYQYLERRYALTGESLHWEPDAAPDDSAWRELEALRARHPAETMIWEAEPLPETADRLRALGIEPIVFDPCARSPEGSDYLDVMRANVERLEARFGS